MVRSEARSNGTGRGQLKGRRRGEGRDKPAGPYESVLKGSSMTMNEVPHANPCIAARFSILTCLTTELQRVRPITTV